MNITINKKLFTFAIIILLTTLIISGIFFYFYKMQNTYSQNNSISKLGDKTEVGNVNLYVKNLEAVERFYKDYVGLKEISRSVGIVVLGMNETKIMTLVEDKNLDFASRGSAGLYHTAILFDSKESLAKSLRNMFEKTPNSFEGSADHLVSEAFYFHDPEGNGVEVYADRPRSEWQWENGKIKMASIYIDPEKFIRENLPTSSEESSYAKASADSSQVRVGHVHLKVGDIPKAKEFYVDTLGFEITAEMPTALFVSAGGYHHHLGMNTWESLGASKRNESLGLKSFEIQVENKDELEKVKARILAKNIEVEEKDGNLEVRDPWGNLVILKVS